MEPRVRGVKTNVKKMNEAHVRQPRMEPQGRGNQNKNRSRVLHVNTETMVKPQMLESQRARWVSDVLASPRPERWFSSQRRSRSRALSRTLSRTRPSPECGWCSEVLLWELSSREAAGYSEVLLWELSPREDVGWYSRAASFAERLVASLARCAL
jgi:hypothetical protein